MNMYKSSCITFLFLYKCVKRKWRFILRVLRPPFSKVVGLLFAGLNDGWLGELCLCMKNCMGDSLFAILLQSSVESLFTMENFMTFLSCVVGLLFAELILFRLSVEALFTRDNLVIQSVVQMNWVESLIFSSYYVCEIFFSVWMVQMFTDSV